MPSQPDKVKITEEQLRSVLGKMVDREAAKVLGVPTDTARYYRDKLGIPPFRIHANNWTTAAVALAVIANWSRIGIAKTSRQLAQHFQLTCSSDAGILVTYYSISSNARETEPIL
ncbi:MAG: hypothetical protein H8E66_12210 [Planctomycetes bacterium]|nr:hypothetical protein [Planctomycetota bacterium]